MVGIFLIVLSVYTISVSPMGGVMATDQSV